MAIEGSVAVVGARSAFSLGKENAGAAYVFDIPAGSDGDAVLGQKIVLANPKANEHFGNSMILKDGHLVVGTDTQPFLYRKEGGLWVRSDDSLPYWDSLINTIRVIEDSLVIGYPMYDYARGHVLAYALVRVCE